VQEDCLFHVSRGQCLNLTGGFAAPYHLCGVHRRSFTFFLSQIDSLQTPFGTNTRFHGSLDANRLHWIEAPREREWRK